VVKITSLARAGAATVTTPIRAGCGVANTGMRRRVAPLPNGARWPTSAPALSRHTTVRCASTSETGVSIRSTTLNRRYLATVAAVAASTAIGAIALMRHFHQKHIRIALRGN